MSVFSNKRNVEPINTNFTKEKGNDSFFGIQAKLNIGKANDKYEVEADQAADKVVTNKQKSNSISFFNPSHKIQNKHNGNLQKKEDNEIQEKPLTDSITPVVQQQNLQQKCDSCEQEDKEKLQTKRENSLQTSDSDETTSKTTSNLENNLNRSKGSGAPLQQNTKNEMESGFGTDFSKVRVHNDSNAVQMNKQLGSQAFANGNDVYFNEGKYNPSSKEGKHLLAHELTHTIQQNKPIQKKIQRKMGDGHDLQSPRFAGNLKLESAFDNESLISIGSQGDHVSKIQQALEDSGHPLPKFGVDGIFGSETQSSVRSYQTSNGLLIDGIVGPETMGSLDSRFSKQDPEPIPPEVPPQVCELLQSEETDSNSKKTLFPIHSLSPDVKKETEEAPTIDLPNGDKAIKCETPPQEKKCAELCGCPLPSSNYQAKVGDLAQVMENATAFHEPNSKSNSDTRTLVCPPKDTPIKVLSIIKTGNLTFLKVRFCNGPIPDKNGTMVSEVLIQQQFVTNGKQLLITGPNEISMPDKITLKAEGAHPGTNPDWDIKHSDHSNGRGKIIGSDKKPEVKIKGKELSSLEGDVTIKLSVCGMIALHRLTIVKPFKLNLPKPKLPKTPVGPQKPPGSPDSFCIPYKTKDEAELERIVARAELVALIKAKHGGDKDVMDLYMKYIDKPKAGVKGTLLPREFFSDQKSNFVNSFMIDPETFKEKKRIQELITSRVKEDPKLIPPVGKKTLLLPFRTVLKNSEILDLPMRFKDPFSKIPGFVAGGFGKDSSDAGDDVRHVDGQFRVINQGGDTLRFQIKYTFDVFDAVDFCPGAPGGLFAKLLLTVALSRLEATPDVPTYDTPFEVLYSLHDDVIEKR